MKLLFRAVCHHHRNKVTKGKDRQKMAVYTQGGKRKEEKLNIHYNDYRYPENKHVNYHHQLHINYHSFSDLIRIVPPPLPNTTSVFLLP